jgi:hypothetical protein
MTAAKPAATPPAVRACLCGCGAPLASRNERGFASGACYHRWASRQRYSADEDAEIERMHMSGMGSTLIGAAMTPPRSKNAVIRRLRTMGLAVQDRGPARGSPPAAAKPAGRSHQAKAGLAARVGAVEIDPLRRIAGAAPLPAGHPLSWHCVCAAAWPEERKPRGAAA